MNLEPADTRNGSQRKVDHWAVKVQYAGRRETVPLATANKDAAANIAKDFYLFLQSHGWEAALQKFKPKSRWSNQAVTTVGEFLERTGGIWSGNPKTLAAEINPGEFSSVAAELLVIWRLNAGLLG
ncbi:MAG: hypothetical protein ABJB69_07455 [Spartobacteria bacterium]